MPQRFFIFFLLLLSLKPLLAQQQMGAFMAYGPEAKYFSNLNFSVHQSKAGFLWFGTQNGIVRFDGKRYKNFFSDYANPNSLSDNTIVDIVEDKKGNLWFCGFYHGLTKYNETTSIFKKYSNPTADNYSFYGIFDGLRDKENNLWFATAGRGLANYIYEKDSFALYFPEPDKCKDGSVRGENYVTGICEDQSDPAILWISSHKGLHSFNKKTKQFVYYPSGVISLPYRTEVQTLSCEADKEGHIWLSSWGGGLLCFNTLTKKYDLQKRKAFPTIINHARLINDTILLAACYDDGLYQLNLRTRVFSNITPPRNPADATYKNTSIQKISLTQQAGIFIGGNYYVYQLDPAFTRLQKNIWYEDASPGADIFLENILWDEHRHQYWISTSYGSGLYQLKEGATKATKISGIPPTPEKYKEFNNLIKDGLQRIWVTSYYGGMYTWDESKKMFTAVATGSTPVPDSLLRSVIGLQTDNAGNIWMLSADNFIYFDVKNNRSQIIPFGWDSNYKGAKTLAPACIRIDSDGNPWVITQNGLFVCKRNEKKVSHIYDTGVGGTTFSHNAFWGGAFDQQDNLWLTSSNGIQVYNTKKEEVAASFSIADGLPSMITTDIAVDKQNRTWVNTAAGLALYDPEKKMWRSFNRLDGMERDYLDGNLTITSNGKIVIDQVTGLLVKDIAEVVSSAQVPVLQITSLTINDKELTSSLQPLQDKKLNLSSTQNNIHLEFAAMDWLYPNKTNYLVKIDGLQTANSWTANPDARINLAGLAPGHYIIHIKAINSSGIWSNQVDLSITIQPPFWKKAWFIVLSILAIALLLYFLYRYRLRQLLKLQQLRSNLSRDLHDEIGSSVSSVNMLSMVAKKKLGDQHPVTALLTQIGESAQNAGDSINEIIWSINPQNDSIERIVLRMKELATEMLEPNEITCHLDFDNSLTQLDIPMQDRRHLFMIYKEALNNMIKYAGCKNALLSMHIREQNLLMEIKDDGQGFDPVHHKPGNGLINMQQRATAMKATLTITASPGKGCSISLCYPIK